LPQRKNFVADFTASAKGPPPGPASEPQPPEAVPEAKSEAAPSTSSEGAPRLSVFVGWLVVAVVDLGVLARQLPGRLPFRVRILVHSYDAAGLLAIGAAVTAVVELYRRFGPKSSRLAHVAMVLLAAVVAYFPLADDLAGPAALVSKRIPF